MTPGVLELRDGGGNIDDVGRRAAGAYGHLSVGAVGAVPRRSLDQEVGMKKRHLVMEDLDAEMDSDGDGKKRIRKERMTDIIYFYHNIVTLKSIMKLRSLFHLYFI